MLPAGGGLLKICEEGRYRGGRVGTPSLQVFYNSCRERRERRGKTCILSSCRLVGPGKLSSVVADRGKGRGLVAAVRIFLLW